MRPVGKRIIQACSLVEQCGTATSPMLTPVMGTAPTNTIKYLSRSVGMGLLTVDRSMRPHRYQVVDGWRETVKPIAREMPYVVRVAPVKPVYHRPRVNSIFNMGAIV